METNTNTVTPKQFDTDFEQQNLDIDLVQTEATKNKNEGGNWQDFSKSFQMIDDSTTPNMAYLQNVPMKSHTIHIGNDVNSIMPMVNFNSPDYYIDNKKKRRKFAYTPNGKLVLVSERSAQHPSINSISADKQQEVLKAAKSLFCKRTRTLYHWLYPTAAKQQIKTVVSSSWEMLRKSEKDFYISQVLGRFGLNQMNLMINPQLDTIKELPPPPPQQLNMKTTKTYELQNAISSISPELSGSNQSSLTFEEFEEINERFKKRRGRPKGSTASKRAKLVPGSSMRDFQDDPELSQELEKFAVKFNLNKM